MKENYKWQYTLIGHLAFLLLFVIAFVFYKERTLNFDTSFYSIRILATGDFYIPHGRGINYLWQWIPLLVFKMGGSLKSFMMAMSLGPLIMLYAFYLFIAHVLKNSKAGVYLVLAMVMCIRYKYYAAISEIYLSIGLIALVVACLSMDKKRFNLKPYQHLLASLFFISLTYLGHPFIIFPLLFVLGADLIWHNRWKDKMAWLGIIGAVILFASRYLLIIFSGASYERGKMGSVGLETFANVILHPSEVYSLSILWSFIDSQWFFAVALFLLSLFFLFRRNKLFAAYLIAFTLCWFVFVAGVCSYLQGDIYAMIEGYCGFFGLAWALPAIYLLPPKYKHSWILPLCISCLLLFSIHRIYKKAPFFTSRLAKIEKTIAENTNIQNRNHMLKMEGRFWKELWYPWSVPYESLILSSLENPNLSSILYIADSEKKIEKYSKQEMRYMPPFNDDTFALPEHYFKVDKRPFVLTDKISF